MKTAFDQTKKKKATTTKVEKTKKLPADFKVYDTNKDNTIAASEIMDLIDSYFEGAANVSFQKIADLIDYYLDE